MLETKRLLLRPFTEDDLEPLYRLLSDQEVNTFLPWFPAESLEDARRFYQQRLAPVYASGKGKAYAVCEKKDNRPLGYVTVDSSPAHDFGYALEKAAWGKGIATEAGAAVLEELRREGIPFVTATHDVNNPPSGAVMKRLGMTYRYSYREQWQPKDFPVVFRMYQLDLDGIARPAYPGYWEKWPEHFVETGL